MPRATRSSARAHQHHPDFVRLGCVRQERALVGSASDASNPSGESLTRRSSAAVHQRGRSLYMSASDVNTVSPGAAISIACEKAIVRATIQRRWDAKNSVANVLPSTLTTTSSAIAAMSGRRSNALRSQDAQRLPRAAVQHMEEYEHRRVEREGMLAVW
jgi:hypothetical protein